jgi:hypothetical protein
VEFLIFGDINTDNLIEGKKKGGGEEGGGGGGEGGGGEEEMHKIYILTYGQSYK